MILPDQWEWQATRPFPHTILDNVITPEHAAALASEFPPPDAGPGVWHTFDQPLELGKQEASAACAGPGVAAVHEFFASAEFIDWLRTITGVPDLVADPDRVGGGIHQSGPGARLGLHVDFNVHPRDPGLVRAVNVILFLTELGPYGDADATWNRALTALRVGVPGGWLMLGHPKDRDCVFVEPKPGRLIVFEASDESWHGHPQPMPDAAPLRKSIPTYFYRPIREDEHIEPRSTRFLDT